ncbi:hypothetical protein PTKIN_Ptkin10aG0036700 [Pterospermum kingtungense]
MVEFFANEIREGHGIKTKIDSVNPRISRWLWGVSHWKGEFMEPVGNSWGLLSCWDDNVFGVEQKIYSSDGNLSRVALAASNTG